MKKREISIYLLIITLNVNGLNSPVKIQFEMDSKQDPTACCLPESHHTGQDLHRRQQGHTESKGWKMIFYANKI
jgi:exonuclease III